MRVDFPHVTSTTTLMKLAECLGEALPGLAARPAISVVPSVESLEKIVAELHHAILGNQPVPAATNRLFAEALRDTLLHLEAEPDAINDPRLSGALARVAIRSRRPLGET
ncbi:hypothetical protein HMP06_0489 [Sphingomonas sp. HMP6]|nr:hypothetical protein HMP06_0489 [Sphingomonas sp. HMP6]